MSRTVSPSSNQPYGVARVTAVWSLARSSFYAARQREHHPREPEKRGPKVRSDEELVAEIRGLLAKPIFMGEGYRKIWARLRFKGVRTSKDRVLRLLREYFGAFSAGAADGLKLRHDHGSVYMSDDFQTEIKFLGIEPSPAFVRQPEGNGCIERFFRTLKEQVLWVRRFRDLEELRAALIEFRDRYNNHWILERLDYRTPTQARRDFQLEQEVAA